MEKILEKYKSPFSATFGKKPDIFNIRNLERTTLIKAYVDENTPYHNTLISGLRGMGKTLMLSDITQELSQYDNWIVVNISLKRGLYRSIVNNLEKQVKSKYELLSKRLNNIKVKILLLEFDIGKSNEIDLENRLIDLLNDLKEKKISVLLVIDEVKSNREIEDFLATYQLLFREGYDICLLMAGLPYNINLIFNAKNITFIRRAKSIYLASLDTPMPP
jgi:predicted AAA+ superfamily ATPase